MNSKSSEPGHWRFWKLVLLLTAINAVVVAIVTPNFVHGGTSKRNGIINRLRQITAAKNEWAFVNGLTNATQLNRAVTEKELAPYLLPDYTTNQEFGNPAFGELYLIRNLDQPCEAVLTKKLTERYSDYSLPRGTVIRMATNGYEIVLPDGTPREY